MWALLVTSISYIFALRSVPSPVLILTHVSVTPPLGCMSTSTEVADEPGETLFHSSLKLFTLTIWMINKTIITADTAITENVTYLIAFFTLSTLFNPVSPVYDPLFKNISGKGLVKIITLYYLTTQSKQCVYLFSLFDTLCKCLGSYRFSKLYHVA